MNFLDKLERKIGRYAIPNLSLYLILGYVLGYVLEFINPNIVYFLSLNPYLILHGQIWRLVTWVIIPPSDFSIWTIIMLFFYYSVGTSLERTWGTFYYNVYLFMGMVFTVIGSFIIMGISYIPSSGYNAMMQMYGVSSFFTLISMNFSTYYINMSIFLAYAATFPDMQVLLMFIIPIKVKWMGIAYAVLLVVEFFQYGLIGRIVIVASLLNFVVFFLLTRKSMLIRMSPKQVKRRHDYKKEVKKAKPMSIAKHKCAVCGRNSEDNPEAEFRFCSKCNGNYEYCQEHLFTHTHVK
jgi:hypothetical protein